MKNYVLQNESGQATTAALIMLPVALAFFIGIVVFSGAMIFESRATAACRSSMADSQKDAAEALNQLLRLNSTAETLETSYQVAKAALYAAQASLWPPAIAAAAAAFALVQLAQAPVIAAQKYWLFKGKQASFLAPIRASNSIRSSLPKFLITLPSFSKVPRFDVIASPPGARTPTYRPAPGFSQSQEGKVRWLLDTKSNFETRQDLTKIRAPKIEVGCAVTLSNQNGGAWEPQITEDKLLRN